MAFFHSLFATHIYSFSPSRPPATVSVSLLQPTMHFLSTSFLLLQIVALVLSESSTSADAITSTEYSSSTPMDSTTVSTTEVSSSASESDSSSTTSPDDLEVSSSLSTSTSTTSRSGSIFNWGIGVSSAKEDLSHVDSLVETLNNINKTDEHDEKKSSELARLSTDGSSTTLIMSSVETSTTSSTAPSINDVVVPVFVDASHKKIGDIDTAANETTHHETHANVSPVMEPKSLGDHHSVHSNKTSKDKVEPEHDTSSAKRPSIQSVTHTPSSGAVRISSIFGSLFLPILLISFTF